MMDRTAYIEHVNDKLRQRIHELEAAIESAQESIHEAREGDMDNTAYNWIGKAQGALQSAMLAKIPEEYLRYSRDR